MKKIKNKRLITFAVVAVLIVAVWYIWYSFPKPLAEFCRDAGWDDFPSGQATLSADYHFYEQGADDVVPVHYHIAMEAVPADDPEFREMLSALWELQSHKALPFSKSRTHPIKAGDFAIYLIYESPEYGPLRVTFWFDELYATFHGEEYICSAKDYDAIAAQVRELVLAHGGEREQFE